MRLKHGPRAHTRRLGLSATLRLRPQSTVKRTLCFHSAVCIVAQVLLLLGTAFSCPAPESPRQLLACTPGSLTPCIGIFTSTFVDLGKFRLTQACISTHSPSDSPSQSHVHHPEVLPGVPLRLVSQHLDIGRGCGFKSRAKSVLDCSVKYGCDGGRLRSRKTGAYRTGSAGLLVHEQGLHHGNQAA